MTISSTVAWLVLLAAGLLEVVWAVSMKASEGFTKPLLTAVTIAAAWFSFWLLGLSLKVLPVGTAYAVWTGIGAIGAAVLGIVLFKEPATVARVGCILLIAASLIALTGCARGQAALDGTQWKLTEWTLSSLDARDFDITAGLADGKISGRSGVNSYGGPYTVGARQSFKVGSIASTEMAGPEPAMRAEGAYLTLLGQANAYRVEAGRLTLLDAGGNESLIFEAAGIRP